MKVFGCTEIHASRPHQGLMLFDAVQSVPLEDAGHADPATHFVNSLSWHTHQQLWCMAPHPPALIAKLEDMAAGSAVELMESGQALGTVVNDVRLRQAMNLLGLSERQLDRNRPDGAELAREAWALVVDHLIGEQARRSTAKMHDALCRLGNSCSIDKAEYWLKKYAWQAEPNRWVIGNPSRVWQLDACPSDLRCRVVARMDMGLRQIVLIKRRISIGSLASPRPSEVEITNYSSNGEFFETLTHLLMPAGQDQAGEHIGDANIRRQYDGKLPICSRLIGLNSEPRLSIRLGELKVGQTAIRLPAVIRGADLIPSAGSKQTLDYLPLAGFASSLHTSLNHQPLLPDDEAIDVVTSARSHLLHGGLYHRMLQPLSSRIGTPLRGLELYRPTNPYAGKRQQAGKLA